MPEALEDFQTLDGSAKLTMHFQGTLGYTGQRTLGRGDILGARALSGG